MINGKTLRDAIISGAHNIVNNKAAVDELNVFPVPDGDTGTNMSMAIMAAEAELTQLPDSATVAQASSCAANALLRGARGNSGVILSLLFRGFAKALADRTEADAADIAAALTKGVAAAYKAVMKPTEGTILTVARVAAERASEQADKMDAGELWDLVVDTAKETLAETPELLPVLKKAGVVDAGGSGLVVIFEGMQQVIKGGKIIALEGESAVSSKKKKGVHSEAIYDEKAKFGYCTEFMVNKNKGADALKLRAFLEAKGDSVVVVDDDDIIKCHVHTPDPGRVLSEAIKYGYLTKLKIENMTEQVSEIKKGESEPEPSDGGEFPYAAPDADTPYGFVAVCAGDGLHELFTQLGANAVVSGGQTMNPSITDIAAAVQSVPAKTVFVLPNNKNIIMAAEQAVRMVDREMVVLPTRTVPQGISAMLAFDPDADVEQNQIGMNNAASAVSTGQITYAVRDSEFDGHDIKEGEILAMLDGKLLFTDTNPINAAAKLARKMCSKQASFLTVISGEDVSEEQEKEVAERIKQRIPASVDVSSIRGGQPVYYFIISVE